MLCLFFFFFFSSRRRHTRCSRDWSSDVCSSDLLRLYTMAELTELCEAVGFRVTRRAFVDQVAAGISPLRRGLRAVLAPARGAWPALRDTCMVQAVRAGLGGGGPCPP